MGRLKFVTVYIVCTLHHTVIFGDLYGDLLTNYRKQLFPTWDRPLGKFKLNLQSYPGVLIDFAETEEKISLTGSITLNWTDQRLTWNPAEYNNIYNMIVSPNEIWLPHLYLGNTVNEVKPLGYDSDSYAYINYNGVIYWTPTSLMEAQCTPNILRFPFETQTCRFEFNMGGVSYANIEMTTSDKPVLEYFRTKTDLEVIHVSQYIYGKTYKAFIIEFTIKRRPMYYIVTVILPTLLFALMNPLVFCLPVESGERISLGMTILLAYAIFLTIVTSSIPELSNPVCAIILVLVLIMLVSGIIVIMTIVSSLYYYKHLKDIDDVNRCLKCLAFKCSNKQKLRNMEENREHLNKDVILTTGQKISRSLDLTFCIISYALFISILGGYALYIVLTR